MRSTLIAMLVVLLAATGAVAQEKKLAEITLAQAVKQPFNFVPRDPPGLGWHPKGEAITMLARGAKGPGLMRISIEDGKRSELVGAADLAAAGKAAGVEGLDFRALIDATWLDEKTLRFVHDGVVCHYDVWEKKLDKSISFPADSEAQAFPKEDSHAAFSKDKDVYVAKPDGTTFRVTTGGHEFLTHGLSVSRVEFGIKDGLWWSPDGRHLAFYREDLSVIRPYPYIDWEPRPAVHKLGRYPMAGQTGSIVTVGVYDTQDDSVVWLKTDTSVDQYLTNVTWGPDSKSLYIAHVNRDQNHTQLVKWNAITGEKIGLLFEERDEEYTEPEHGPIFLPDDSGDFLWFSERGGYNDLYLHKADGHLMQKVTVGDFDVASFEGFSDDGEAIYVSATGADPRQQHLFRAELAPGPFRVEFGKDGKTAVFKSDAAMTQLTKGRGVHDAKISPDGKYVLDSHSNLESAGAIEILNLEKDSTYTIQKKRNPWDRFQGGREEFFTIKAKDGADLYGHLVLPPDMKKGKKYPVLLYVYGGPHLQLVRDEFLGGAGFSGPWFHYMANQGIIVLRLDNHGTPNRGIDFEQSIHRQMGTLEVEDQVAGLKHVIAQGYADPERVGVHGWSYGGFMTLSLMTRAGEHFHCGIAGAPVTDWAYYETGYGERYMDRPQENPKGYENAKPANHLDGLEGRLLVVHGSSDDTCVWQHTIDFVDACVTADKPVEYMVYPGQLHGLRGPYRWHFYQKMTAFFLEEL